jgi:hypothetical protein
LFFSPSFFPTNYFMLVPSRFARCFAPMFTFCLATSPFVLLPHPSFYCFALVFHAYSITFHLLVPPLNLLPHPSSCYLAVQLIVPHLCFILCFISPYYFLHHLVISHFFKYLLLLLPLCC